MVAFKAAQVASFLKSPDRRFAAVLLYGPDPSVVAERARQLARRIAGTGDDAGEIVRLDDRDLAEDADKLAVELQTVSMFASRAVVRIRAEQRLKPEELERLIGEPLEAYLIVEAGNLRPDAKLRRVFEASDRAAALPCYSDSARDIAPLIDAELAAHGVQITPDARTHLIARLGGDISLARSESAKLALYARETGRVELEDVDAVVGNAAAPALDALAAAAAGGKTREALHQLDRLLASGQTAQGALTALGRHMERLHRVCASVEAGQAARDAVSAFRPPLHFKLRDVLLAQHSRWSRARAADALQLVQETTRQARRLPALERQLTERAVIALSAQ